MKTGGKPKSGCVLWGVVAGTPLLVTDLRSGLCVSVRSYGSKPVSGRSPGFNYGSKPKGSVLDGCFNGATTYFKTNTKQ